METKEDSFQTRLEEAAEHMEMQPEHLKEVLADLGIKDTPKILEALSNPEDIKLFGELRAALPDAVKNIQIRLAVNALAGPKKEKKASSGQPDRFSELRRRFGIGRDIKHVPTADLLREYKPEDHNDPVTQEVMRRFDATTSNGSARKVILFRPGTTEVAVDETVDYIASLDAGLAEAATVMVDGEPVEPVEAGVVPDKVLEEDPLFPGHALWKGKSRKNNVNYDKVGPKERQFLRILVERREIDLSPARRSDVSSLIALLISDGVSALCETYPEAYLLFKRHEKLGDLPKLVIRQDQTGKKNDPFGGNRRF